jgi:signal transduction histidine kinase
MKSVSTKIILWSAGALVLSLAIFIIVSQVVIGSTLLVGLERFSDFQFQQAREAYEHGGQAELSTYLEKLNRSIGTDYHLTDGTGRDLQTGANQRERILRSRSRWKKSGDEVTFGKFSRDGRYGWLAIAKPPFSMLVFAPFYLLVLATVGALYWLVTSQIASPLRRLARVVDRFGQGELGARAASGSKDEIGNLGRSFNAMADRIQSLLTAERQLLQDVSHELRSPLARLTFEAEMVRRTNDRDASAARLRHEIERLSELVASLIDMARAEREPSTVAIGVVCLNDLLQEIAADCEVEASAKQCAISFRAAAAVDVRGNDELLHRAFENVIRNAIRYSPPGAPIEIELTNGRNIVTVGVRDFGPGIPEPKIARIFDPFFRVDASRDETTGGLGLGLAIARRAIRAHGGDITASNASPGALLSITIPASQKSPQPPSPA